MKKFDDKFSDRGLSDSSREFRQMLNEQRDNRRFYITLGVTIATLVIAFITLIVTIIN